MLPLAEWVMRGRGQAIAVIVAGLLLSPLFWPSSIIASAAVALVTLRTGSRNGLTLWFWSLLPAIALVMMGSYLPLLLISLSFAISAQLRQTQSWSYALMSLSIMGLLIAYLLQTLAQETLAIYVDVIHQALRNIEAQVDDASVYQTLLQVVDNSFIAGMLAILLVSSGFLSLVLARYWQARLFNPGGFQQEFHKLRLDKVWMAVSILLLLLFLSLGEQYVTWVWLALFPMLIAGVALFHAMAKHRKLRKHWYVIFYCILLLGDVPKILLVVMALVDSVVDFRKKWSEHNTD